MKGNGPFAGSFVELHEVGADGHAAAPEMIPVQAPARSGTPILVIAAGPFAYAAASAQAVRIARRHTGGALRLAVVEIEDGPVAPDETHRGELEAAFDAVVAVTRGRRRQLVSRLLRTILRRDGQDQPVGCDWDDVSHILGTSRGAAVRFGCGHATGGTRASLAALEAIRQADSRGPGLRAAHGVCVGIRAASTTIGGSEIKEAIHLVRARVHPRAAITMSIGSESALEDGAFEVDIFAFGQFDAAELARQGTGADDALPDQAADPEAPGQGKEALRDPLYGAARSLVIRSQRASISLVQRHLRIGYGHACRLLESMEGDILSAPGEDGKRTVLVPGQTPQHSWRP
ncbi:DNA translocase FtsK [Massilia litorea]|nr:DNA translocase FtsK [Massilia litorea]